MIEFPITLTSGGSVCMPGYVFALALGYTKNLGVYRLHVDATGEWEGLTIRCFWHVPDGKDPSSSLVVDGYVDVPASVTAQPGSGCITFEGSDDTKNITSADLHYRVSANSGTEDGTEPEPGTPAWQQLVDAVHTDATAAEQAKTDAQTAAQQAGASAQKAGNALSDTITAKEDALKATKDAQTAANEATTSAGSADKSAQEAAGSLQELKNGIASGEFKGEPGNDGKSPVVTVTDIENGHRVSITDKDGTKTIDVLNGKDGKDAPQIDDTTVTDSAPWSSKHIVDVLCPPISETGNPAQFYPVAGYPLGCKVSWEPTQEGSGEPSPENVRPIKGRDSVQVERCGENLYNVNHFIGSYWVDDNYHKSNDFVNIHSSFWASYKVPCNVGDTINVSGFPELGGISCVWTSDVSGEKYFKEAGSSQRVNASYAVPSGAQCLVLGVAGKLSMPDANYDNAMISIGAAPTTYAPYTGQTATLTLPRTIYGGTVDTVSSEGQETRKLLTLDGTEKWMVSGKFLDNKTDWYYVSSKIPNAVNAAPQKGNEICSHYPHADIANTNTAQGCAIVWGAIRVRWGDTIPDDADAWKAHLAAQYAAGTPVQIAYKLAEPVPFTVTGAQPISALSGVNTLLTDADSVTVTGRADPIKRITDLEDAVASMT